MVGEDLKYDRTFCGNILAVGQTRRRKIYFVQNLGKNKIFGNIMSVDWISKIESSENREHHLRQTFSYTSVEFHYPNNTNEFETILDLLKGNKNIVNNNACTEIHEGDVLDRLIVMDDVSGLADKSTEFSSFLMVSKKYDYTCVYIFHIIFPHTFHWQMILSQTKMFNIFLSAIQLGNMSKILTNNCDRETIKYIPKRELWINRLYFEIAKKIILV